MEFLPIIEYAVLYSDGVTHVASGSVASNSYEVTGLVEKGTYRFQLRAHNEKGWSVAGDLTEEIAMPACGASRPDAPPGKISLTQIGSCSASIQWTRVTGRGTGGAPIESQQIRARPKGGDFSSDETIVAEMPADASAGVVSGLRSHTQYFFSVRAKNVLGWSDNSDAVSGATPVAASSAGRPSQPLPPHYVYISTEDGGAPVLPAAAGSCDTLEVELPALRGGCDHDEYLTLEWRVGVSPLWTAVPRAHFRGESAMAPAAGETPMPQLTTTRVVLGGLDSYTAYRLRTLAHNSVGGSAASPASAALFTQGSATSFDPSPKALVTSSSSYLLMWPPQACRPEMTWQVYMQRSAGAGGSALAEPMLLNSSVSGGTFAANSLRCPQGCSFGVIPNAASLAGFNTTAAGGVPTAPDAVAPMHMSESVPTPPLPPLAEGSVRVELRLARDFGSEDLLLVQEELKSDLESVLGLPPESVSLVQVYGAGQFYICDLAEAASEKLISTAQGLGSAFLSARVLGSLDSILRLDGLGSTAETVLASDLQKLGSGYGVATIGELVMIVSFVCGVLLSCGLVLMIGYGTCKQSAGEAIPALDTKKKKKADKARAREATSGTAEEKIGLAADDERDSKEDDDDADGGMADAVEAGTATRLASAVVGGGSTNGGVRVAAGRGGDELHVDVSAEPPAALGIQAPPERASRDDGVDIDEVVNAALAARGSCGGHESTSRGNGLLLGGMD